MTSKIESRAIDRPIVGMIGFGSIATKHIKVLSSLRPSASFHVLSSRNLSETPCKADVTFHTTFASLLQNKPNMIVIASAASQHLIYFQNAVTTGLPILVEKPIAHTKSDAEKMKKIAQMAKVRPVVGYNMRFSEAFRVVNKIIKNRELGKIFSVYTVVGQNLETWRPGRNLNTTVSSSKEKGGGVLRELSHEIDYLSTLFGDITDVVGMLDRRKFSDFNVEDTALLLLRCRKNDDTIPISLNMDFTRHDNARYCHIVGDGGTLRWDAISGKVSIHAPSGNVEEVYSNSNDLKLSSVNMWNAFIDRDISSFADVFTSTNLISWIEYLENKSLKDY